MNSFEDVSITQRLRIMGDDVRLFRCCLRHHPSSFSPLGIVLHVKP